MPKILIYFQKDTLDWCAGTSEIQHELLTLSKNVKVTRNFCDEEIQYFVIPDNGRKPSATHFGEVISLSELKKKLSLTNHSARINYTTDELISALHAQNIALPKRRQRKQFYVDLLNEHKKFEPHIENNVLATTRRRSKSLSDSDNNEKAQTIVRKPSRFRVASDDDAMRKPSTSRTKVRRSSKFEVESDNDEKTMVRKPSWSKIDRDNKNQTTFLTAAHAFSQLENSSALQSKPTVKFSLGYIAMLIALSKFDFFSLETIAKAIETTLQWMKIPPSNTSQEKALIQLHNFVADFATTDASIEVVIWPKLNAIIESYFGVFFLEKTTNDIISKVRYDPMCSVIQEMSIYATQTVRKNSMRLQSSFLLLSEDYIFAECALSAHVAQTTLDQEKVHENLMKWNHLRKGIITRIWYSKREPDEIRKLRTILRFFPVPYQLGSRSILPLLNPTSLSCQKFNYSKALQKFTEEKVIGCGCNCACSSSLTMLLANEVGLLGTRVHCVNSKTHAYIAIGNRHTDWKDHKVQIIETTERNDFNDDDYCTKPLISLREVQGTEDMYRSDDYLTPNIREFYLRSVMIFIDSFSPLSLAWMHEMLTQTCENIFGANLLLSRLDFHEPIYYKEQIQRDTGIHTRLRMLIQKELNESSVHDLGINTELDLYAVVATYFAYENSSGTRADIEHLFNHIVSSDKQVPDTHWEQLKYYKTA